MDRVPSSRRGPTPPWTVWKASRPGDQHYQESVQECADSIAHAMAIEGIDAATRQRVLGHLGVSFGPPPMQPESERPADSHQAWTDGMLVQLARDLETVKEALGVDRDEEGDLVRTAPADGSMDARDEWTDLPGAPSEGEI